MGAPSNHVGSIEGYTIYRMISHHGHNETTSPAYLPVKPATSTRSLYAYMSRPPASASERRSLRLDIYAETEQVSGSAWRSGRHTLRTICDEAIIGSCIPALATLARDQQWHGNKPVPSSAPQILDHEILCPFVRDPDLIDRVDMFYET